MSYALRRGGEWHKPLPWLLLSLVPCCGLQATWFLGAFSGGMDVKETCELMEGQTYDPAYRDENRQESSQLFPLHDKCNASYDLVPAWINPTIVFLAVAMAGCLITAVVMTATYSKMTQRLQHLPEHL
ncbi:hypothetical protein OG407_47975 [Streptomyces sp. NBC_01515]|uniref:hypothetical protein n=1 Tax=Streptomyces sp. NBC_01515 TaxID=2903890 RepID=UPI00386AB8B4